MTSYTREELLKDWGQALDRAFAPPATYPDRRERIATAALQGLLTRNMLDGSYQTTAQKAVLYANALIRELDKKEDGA